MLHITEAMHRCQSFRKKVEIYSLLKKDWLKGLRIAERFLYIIFCIATVYKNLVQSYSEKMIESLKTET
jgi:hypothetical protein